MVRATGAVGAGASAAYVGCRSYSVLRSTQYGVPAPADRDHVHGPRMTHPPVSRRLRPRVWSRRHRLLSSDSPPTPLFALFIERNRPSHTPGSKMAGNSASLLPDPTADLNWNQYNGGKCSDVVRAPVELTWYPSLAGSNPRNFRTQRQCPPGEALC
ncbi:hypothetical protein BO71DRAFT_402239, partial [Aspergillus ellipticus CBS 707.79]